MKHIIYISDFNVGEADSSAKAVARSGYANIGFELCRRLTEMGNEVKVLGLGYTGQEHLEKFSIIPCNTLQDAASYMNNLKFLWTDGGRDPQKGEGVNGVDRGPVIAALHLEAGERATHRGLKYICITPLE